MPQPPTVQDAPVGEVVVHGCFLVQCNLGPIFVAEDLEWSKGFRSVEFADYSNDSVSGQPGAIRRAAYSAEKGRGAMTLQLRTVDDMIFPGYFFEFLHPLFTSVKTIVTNVGHVYTQSGARKIRVEFAEFMSQSALPSNISLDGDFANALPCGPIRFSRPLMNAGNNVLMYRQKFSQFRPFWQPLPPNSVGVPNTYLVDETELEDTGVANIVTWDRVYSTLPPNYNEKGTIVKTIKYLRTAFQGTTIVNAAVATQSKTVECDINWTFYLGSPNVTLPNVSDVSIETVGPFTSIVATGGFFYDHTGGSNAGYRFLQGEIGRWQGNIYYKKEIFG